MEQAKLDLVKKWLVKAKNDLASAKKLAKGRAPYLDTAIYHCQQAAEKAVKGFLVFKDKRVEKTHDIQYLVTQAADIDETMSKWLDAAENLTPYATFFRYPGELLEPSQEEFEEAYSDADALYSYVISVLPADTHP